MNHELRSPLSDYLGTLPTCFETEALPGLQKYSHVTWMRGSQNDLQAHNLAVNMMGPNQ